MMFKGDGETIRFQVSTPYICSMPDGPEKEKAQSKWSGRRAVQSFPDVLTWQRHVRNYALKQGCYRECLDAAPSREFIKRLWDLCKEKGE